MCIRDSAVTAYNTTPASDAAALLDRGYQRDGAYVYFADAAEGRVLVAVKSTLSGDTRTFAVQEILRAGEGESLYIDVYKRQVEYTTPVGSCQEPAEKFSYGRKLCCRNDKRQSFQFPSSTRLFCSTLPFVPFKQKRN